MGVSVRECNGLIVCNPGKSKVLIFKDQHWADVFEHDAPNAAVWYCYLHNF